MKKILALTVAVIVAALAFSATSAGEAAGAVSLTGWIVDKDCGKANANVAGKDCVLSCNKKGSPLVLSSGDKLYPLSDQKTARQNVGYEVVVTGTVDAKGVVEVTSISKKAAPNRG